MFYIRRRINGVWKDQARYADRDHALEVYNQMPVPRMFIGPKGIEHKQYTDNGFVYNGPGKGKE